jgi:ABC-2 type transport system ATP-binding protein
MIEMVGVATSFRAPLPYLDGCSLRVGAGQVHALVGPARSGKTLVLDVLLGLRRPVSGVSQVLGLDSVEMASEVRQRVTHVPPEGRMDLSLNFYEHAHWVLRLVGEPATRLEIRRALRDAEVPDRYFDRAIREAPVECRILAWVAMAALRRHQVLLLDDPAYRLSTIGMKRVARVLRERRDGGACVLVTCGDPRFGEDVADVITAIDLGRTIASRPAIRQPLVSSSIPSLGPLPPKL